MRSLILILSTGLLVALCQAAPSAVIRSIGEVNRLSQNEASAALPVRLTGVVTYSDPEWGLLFVEDATGALFVNTKGTAVNFSPETRVTVEGMTAPGDLAPVVTRPVVKVLGAAPMPTPVPASINDLEAGRLDSRWVEVSGVVRLSPRKWGRTSFLLHRGGVATWVMLPRPDDGLAERFVDAVVRVRGVCGSRIRHGQRVGAQLFVSRPEDIVVE
ncbi:MAG: hypothetical protein SFV51_26425, partial [Bryobacteraceae bacterium]|nr:hypothetical protein [Bryobacteraceae bacterium]